MEAEEEVTTLRLPPEGQNKDDLFPIAKGKRTKRYRLHSPVAFTIKTPSITEDYNITTTTNNNLQSHHHHHPISPSSVSSEESTTTREEDTARCLILLAQGHNFSKQYLPNNINNNNNKRHLENDTETDANAAPVGGGGNKTKGSCMYVCKTCSRAFSSFQALGGHRASHKKPKNEKRLALIFGDHGDDFPSPPSGSSSKNRMSPNYSLSLQLSNFSTTTASASATTKSSPSPKIHVCSHCGAEFTSGQALGGHMRRHRAGPNGPSPNPPAAYICNGDPEPENEELKTPKNGLSLDLNLPAPEVVDRHY